jgi:preprotein translocase subunit SecA
MLSFIKTIFGSRNARTLKRLHEKVRAINALEPSMQNLSDADLAAKTPYFKDKLANGESLDDILVEAFAVVREVSQRTLNLRHFDVQLIGGMVLHQGNIAEMGTGEGKTLSATLPVYLNALTGLGVHIVTVNDYLARRDSQWMQPIYNFLGLSVGVVYHDMDATTKKQAYLSDIVFATNNELGFDYLRDNMVFNLEDKVQRELNFAVIDEVDSILIDEARTPLIISGAAEDSSELYMKIDLIVAKLKCSTETELGDYTLDEKQKQVHLTEDGQQRVEELLVEAKLLEHHDSLYSASNIILMHHVYAALRANIMFRRDVDYIVRNQQVVIVDEHTGRTMPGRRWSDGLHQAIEAKERVVIQPENQTLASITFQNFFRLYHKLSGMTGTADTEAYELHQIYNLEVVVIPTNKVRARVDSPDLIYLTLDEKYNAIIEDIKDCLKRKQPVLVGTASIDVSEHLSSLLDKDNIKHQVLNAKLHEKEAHIIAEAGRPGVVTIATNMAGRGTDIVLGGSLGYDPQDHNQEANLQQKFKLAWQQRHDEVVASGGLRIIGSERHESRRIDNQLRGRSGRQGDPGSTRFYLSLDDSLMRIFASPTVSAMMRRLGMGSNEPIEHNLVTKAIENAQRKLEGHYFDVRKQLLTYDNVANDQRKVIYAQRASIMALDDVTSVIETMLVDVVSNLMQRYIPDNSLEDEWEVAKLVQELAESFNIITDLQAWLDADPSIEISAIHQKIQNLFVERFTQKYNELDIKVRMHFEKSVILQVMDNSWREHLAAMDSLRQGIHLRGYAQKDPKQEYKREAFAIFSEMLESIKYEIIKILSIVEIKNSDDIEKFESKKMPASNQAPLNLMHSADVVDPGLKLKRNDPCHCGSGKKFKLCHGRI